MIVGTAGHIDHGKTTLVRALTGVDTDRLPEEKSRGMSIELGFAYLDLPGGGGDERIGFIDVPGHERLVHTMLAGVTGIDFGLLLVAADDGVMPQTREHVAVLSLLGLRRGAVALTKIDRVAAGRVAQVRAEIAALLVDTPLADAPVLPVSALSGEGIDALRRLIFAAARGGNGSIGAEPPTSAPGAAKVAARSAATAGAAGKTVDAGSAGDALQPAFRLAIDRAFTLTGTGTVVTGTVHAGRLQIGDELQVVPASDASARARVRSLHAQNREVVGACAGQRCAVGLAGTGRDDVARGRWLVDPAIAIASERLDVLLTLWGGEARPLRSGTPVHVHIGAGDCLGTVTVLRALPGPADEDDDADANTNSSSVGVGVDAGVGSTTDAGIVGAASSAAAPADVLAPGHRAYVQIVLRQPVAVWRGDRIVLRDASASRTVAGGIVLDPSAPARYRRSAERLAALDAWTMPTASARLVRLIDAAPQGVSLRRWAVAEGFSSAMAPPLPPDTLTATDSATGDWALAGSHSKALASAVVHALRDFHRREPELLGPDASRLRRLAAPRLPVPLWRALLAGLQQQGLVAGKGACLNLPEHGLRLSATDERLAQRITPLLASAGFEGAWARDLARAAGASESLMRTTVARLAQRGDLHQVVRDLCYPAATVARLAGYARNIAAADGGAVTAGRFRDATGLGRKRAIQVLEYFDRIGLLRRVGDTHRLRMDSGLFAADGD